MCPRMMMMVSLFSVSVVFGAKCGVISRCERLGRCGQDVRSVHRRAGVMKLQRKTSSGWNTVITNKLPGSTEPSCGTFHLPLLLISVPFSALLLCGHDTATSWSRGRICCLPLCVMLPKTRADHRSSPAYTSHHLTLYFSHPRLTSDS